MLWVGLTGGIASGKSTVSQIFKEAGAFIVDADQIGHDLLAKDRPAYRPILQAFGTKVLDDRGEIDRSQLGEIVFHNPKSMSLLNRIMHPLIFEVADLERTRIMIENPRAIIIFNAPLLIETKAHEKMDLLIVVYLDRITQIERLCLRDHLSSSDAQLRIDMQMPLDQKVLLANELIDNRQSMQDVREDVLQIYERLCVATTA